jgi:hypothetical protein
MVGDCEDCDDDHHTHSADHDQVEHGLPPPVPAL